MSIFFNKPRFKTYMTAGLICIVSVVLVTTYLVSGQYRHGGIVDNPCSKDMEPKFMVLFADRIEIMNVEIFTRLLSYIRYFNQFNEGEIVRCRLIGRPNKFTMPEIDGIYRMPEIHEIRLTLSHTSYEEISSEIKKKGIKELV